MEEHSDTLQKNKETLQQWLTQDIQKSNEELKEELRGQLKDDHEKNKEELKHQLEGYCEDIKRKVSETNEKIKTTSETVAKAQEGILSKIKAVEDEGRIARDELQLITTTECTRNKQEAVSYTHLQNK